MIELHGWMTVLETPGDEDAISQQELDRICSDVQALLSEMDCGVELQYRNGQVFLSTLYCGNHRTPQADAIISTYRRIAEIASGSYGMLCIRDDEDNAFSNAFQILVFRRGSGHWRTDTDFSPCIPVIEDQPAAQ